MLIMQTSKKTAQDQIKNVKKNKEGISILDPSLVTVAVCRVAFTSKWRKFVQKYLLPAWQLSRPMEPVVNSLQESQNPQGSCHWTGRWAQGEMFYERRLGRVGRYLRGEFFDLQKKLALIRFMENSSFEFPLLLGVIFIRVFPAGSEAQRWEASGLGGEAWPQFLVGDNLPRGCVGVPPF